MNIGKTIEQSLFERSCLKSLEEIEPRHRQYVLAFCSSFRIPLVKGVDVETMAKEIKKGISEKTVHEYDDGHGMPSFITTSIKNKLGL